MSLRDSIRAITPSFILNWNRQRKKNARRAALELQKMAGKAITKEQLIQDFSELGIGKGDVVLVHSSLSKIGFLEKGAETFVKALQELITDEGTVLMPTSPNPEYQYDFIKRGLIFDVRNTPSKTGAITEFFRKLPDVKRSIHPTEPVAAWGHNADAYIKEHFGQLTPYNSKSPFYKVSATQGKLVYVGVTLANAGTNLHTLEDAVDFKFPVYSDEIFEVQVIDDNGKEHLVHTKVHNPEYSKKRKCDELIPLFKQAGILKEGNIGEAPALVFDAHGFFVTMLKLYNEAGVTMYTPQGSR